MKTQVNLYYY